MLRGATRRDDVAARVGGDEFMVVLTDVTEPGKAVAVAVAERILAALAASPVAAAGDEITIRASIGLATTHPDDTAQQLKRRADLAMYESKRAGGHGWRMYDPSMTDRRTRDALIAEGLLNALGTDQLAVVYQPLVDLGTHRPAAVEGALRSGRDQCGAGDRPGSAAGGDRRVRACRRQRQPPVRSGAGRSGGHDRARSREHGRDRPRRDRPRGDQPGPAGR